MHRLTFFHHRYSQAQAFERSSTQFESQKNKLAEENADVKEKLVILESSCADFTKKCKNLESDLAEQKTALKTAVKVNALSHFYALLNLAHNAFRKCHGCFIDRGALRQPVEVAAPQSKFTPPLPLIAC